MINEVTLFCFWGVGDTLNYSWAPRLIKERISKNIKVYVLVKKSHEHIFKNNRYVDKLVVVDDGFADTYKKSANIGQMPNEINMWCLLQPKTIMNYNYWDIAYESGRNINVLFHEDIIKQDDSLLPELYYTDEQIQFAEDFKAKYYPYIIVETEFKSGQSDFDANYIIANIAYGIKECKYNVFSSAAFYQLVPPFNNLLHIPLPEIGLLIERSKAFYGLGSGLTTVSFEKTLSEPERRVIAVRRNNCIDYHTKKTNILNTILISNDAYVCFTIRDINNLNKKINIVNN